MKLGLSFDQYLIVIKTLEFLQASKDFLLIPEIQKLQPILEACHKDVITEKSPNNTIRKLIESLIHSNTFMHLTDEQNKILYLLSLHFEPDGLENCLVTFERER
jgi:hypothetical protein